MITKFDLGEKLWYVNNRYDYPGDWAKAKVCQSSVLRINMWADKDGNQRTQYTLSDYEPGVPPNRFHWEFMEDKLFSNPEDAAEFLRKKRRSFLQDDVYKARKVLDECQRKLEEFDRKHDK